MKDVTKKAIKTGSTMSVGVALAVIIVQILGHFNIAAPDTVVAPLGALLGHVVHTIEAQLNKRMPEPTKKTNTKKTETNSGQ